MCYFIKIIISQGHVWMSEKREGEEERKELRWGREERGGSGKSREKNIHTRERVTETERDRELDSERMILQEWANMVNFS